MNFNKYLAIKFSFTMKTLKHLTIILLAIVTFSCGDNIETIKNSLSIKTNTENGTIGLDKTLEVAVINPKNFEISSVEFSLDGKTISEKQPLKDFKLGEHQIIAKVTIDGNTVNIEETISILNDKNPEFLKVEIINTYPHDKTAFTQGLEFYNGVLYESTGQRGESKIKKIDYKTGDVLQDISIPDAFFGEGITILDNTVYQLTWMAKKGFTYNADTLEKTGSFNYGESKEGWGFCNDGKQLYKSDGTSIIWLINPETLVEENKIQVCTSKGKIGRLNEIEWVNDKIYVNIWQRKGIAVINPKNGAVDAVIDCKLLTDQIANFSLDENTLNGIAYNPDTETFFLTGKRWDKLFEVKIVK